MHAVTLLEERFEHVFDVLKSVVMIAVAMGLTVRLDATVMLLACTLLACSVKMLAFVFDSVVMLPYGEVRAVTFERLLIVACKDPKLLVRMFELITL